jgi:hypothetical protein
MILRSFTRTHRLVLLWPILLFGHEDVRCLSGLDLSDYDFLSVSKDGFVPVHVKPVENWLNHTYC